LKLKLLKDPIETTSPKYKLKRYLCSLHK